MGSIRSRGSLRNSGKGRLRMAKSAVLAYSLSGDADILALADDIASRITPEMKFNTIIQRSMISDEVEARAVALSTLLDLYEVTADRKHLGRARELADDAIHRFLYRGLFVSRCNCIRRATSRYLSRFMTAGRRRATWR